MSGNATEAQVKAMHEAIMNRLLRDVATPQELASEARLALTGLRGAIRGDKSRSRTERWLQRQRKAGNVESTRIGQQTFWSLSAAARAALHRTGEGGEG